MTLKNKNSLTKLFLKIAAKSFSSKQVDVTYINIKPLLNILNWPGHKLNWISSIELFSICFYN